MTTLDWWILLPLLPLVLMAWASEGFWIYWGPKVISGPYKLYAAFALSYVFFWPEHLASNLGIGRPGKLTLFGAILCVAVSGIAEIIAAFRQHQTKLVLRKYGAETGQQDVIDTLLNRGANIDGKDKLGETALMWAASRGHRDIVRLLLENGAKPEDVDKSGNTALTLAETSKYTDDATKKAIVEMLQAAQGKPQEK